MPLPLFIPDTQPNGEEPVTRTEFVSSPPHCFTRMHSIRDSNMRMISLSSRNSLFSFYRCYHLSGSHKWELGSPGWTSSEGIKVQMYNINPGFWGTSGTAITRIGVIAHELAHYFGFPDLIDGEGGWGIGNHGLLGNSWGFDSSQRYPPYPDPWTMKEVKWEIPAEITANGIYTVTKTGVLGGNHTYRIACGFPSPSTEYLLVQYRHDDPNRDADKGIVIYHIDETAALNTEGYPGKVGWPAAHYKIAVVQADGRYELEKGYNRGDTTDFYKNNTRIRSSVRSQPNSAAYQGGILKSTGIEIRINSNPTGDTMTFQVVSGCTSTLNRRARISTPTQVPTVQPTQQQT